MNKLIKTGIVSFIPEIPATAGRPAFCRTEYYPVTEWQIVDGMVRPIIVIHSREQCYPAIPPTPSVASEQSIKPMTGWNAGAISNQSFTGNCEFSFTVASNPIGIICGLTNYTEQRSYYSIKHGFLVKADDNGKAECFVIEMGKIIKPVAINLLSQPRFCITIIDGVVNYLIDEQLIYSSNNTIRGNIYAAATLYLVNDFVIYPEFKALTDNLSWPLTINLHGGNLPGNYINLAINPLAIEIEQGNNINMALEPFDLIAFNKDFARVDLPLRPLSISTEADQAPNIQVSTINIALDSFYLEPMYVPVNDVATINIPIDLSLGYITDLPYLAEVNIALPAFEMASNSINEPVDQIAHQEYLILNTATYNENAFLVIFTENITLNSTVDIGLILNLTLTETLQIDESLSFAGALALLIKEQIKIVSNAKAPEETKNYQYAVNATNYALSLYENFDFIGFANCHGVSYGIKADGLYRLTGNSDNGQSITAEIDIGAKDWGMPNIKRVSSAYLGIRSDGDAYLKVIVDDKHTNVYRFEESQSQRRTFMSKGVNGRYWRMKLILEDASYAELDSLEFEVGLSQRRIRR